MEALAGAVSLSSSLLHSRVNSGRFSSKDAACRSARRVEVSHFAVELKLVHRLRDSAYLETCGDAQFEQVPSLQDRRLGSVLEMQLADPAREPVRGVAPARRSRPPE